MSDLISRCKLFDRLATIPAPPEANDFKAEIYKAIQEMEAVEVAYFCDRNKCERCYPLCDLTRDKEHAVTTEKLVVLDGVSEMRGGWIPCTKRLPKEQTMSRYVDAEYVKAVMLNDRLMQGNAEFTLYVQQVETQVNALPGIDIVRCSECKHWRTYETWSECELWTDDPYESAKTKANDFCSYGCKKGADND